MNDRTDNQVVDRNAQNAAMQEGQMADADWFMKNNPYDILDKIRAEPTMSLWVFNITPQLQRSKFNSSQIHFSINVNDTVHSVVVPLTFVPVDLGQQIPKKHLFDSADFLRAVNTKKILPILHKDAMKFFEGDASRREELERVTVRMNKIDQEATSIDPSQFTQTAQGEDVDDSLKNVTGKVAAAVEAFTQNEMKANELLSVIKPISLSAADKDHIRSRVSDERVLAYLNSKR